MTLPTESETWNDFKTHYRSRTVVDTLWEAVHYQILCSPIFSTSSQQSLLLLDTSTPRQKNGRQTTTFRRLNILDRPGWTNSPNSQDAIKEGARNASKTAEDGTACRYILMCLANGDRRMVATNIVLAHFACQFSRLATNCIDSRTTLDNKGKAADE
jgi:hypothetical protein